MSAEESLSMASVAGLIASVGRPCHFERGAMVNPSLYEPGADTIIVIPVIDLYLDHLRHERRLADHTLESYARDLNGLSEFAAGVERKVEALDRRALEAFVRQRMSAGHSPRSVARAVAAIRGFYRFLVLDRRLAESPAEDLRPPKAW